MRHRAAARATRSCAAPVGQSAADEGMVAVEWSLAIAVLLVPILVLVAVLPTWSARSAAARLSAEQGARAAAQVDGVAAAVAAGQAQAAVVVSNHGFADALAEVDITVPDADGDGVLDRDGAVVATVSVAVPGVSLPLLGTVGGFHATARHAEPVDPYRSIGP